MGDASARRLEPAASDSTVLGVLLGGDAMTRSQICAATGLSRPTVVDVLARMSGRGMTETETRSLGLAGRNPELISLSPTRAVGFAADVGGSKVVTALVDFAGRVLAERETRTCPEVEQLADQLGELRRDLSREAAVQLRSVVTAVVGLPGVIGADGRIAHGDNISGLDSRDVRALLRRHLNCPVTIENDVNLAGVGEIDHDGAGRAGTQVLISVGTGIGMAIVHEGRVIRGATGRAGEIAFLPVSGDLTDPRVRSHGAAELAVSGPALERTYAELSRREPAERILELAASGDAVASGVLAGFAHDLAGVVLSVAAVLDPDRIVLGGGLGANPLLLGPVNDALALISPFPVEVGVSALGNRSGIRGAMALARDDVRRALADELAGGMAGSVRSSAGRSARSRKED